MKIKDFFRPFAGLAVDQKPWNWYKAGTGGTFMNLWIPDSPDFEPLAARLRAVFPEIPVRNGHSDNPEDVNVVELPAAGEEHILQVSSRGGARTEYRYPRDVELLVEDVRVRVAALQPQKKSGDEDSLPDVPDLGEEVFTLGGLRVGSPDKSMEGMPIPLPESKAEAKVPEVPEAVFSLGGAPMDGQAIEAAPARPEEDERSPERITSPGILRRNTVAASVEDIEQLSLGGNAMREFTLPVWDGNTAAFFLELHQRRFSGQVEVFLPSIRLVFSWTGGRIAGVEGIAPILARLLQLGADGIGLDLTRTLSDPIEWAQRRRLIAAGEEKYWMDRCRREAVRLAAASRRSPIVASGEEVPAQAAPLDPRGPLFGGIMEHMSADEACALCDGEEPHLLLQAWDDLFADPDFDPVWIRALRLFAGGLSWEEACVRSGMGMAESWKLAYASRLFGLASLALPENPAAEIRRRRFRRFEESLQSGNPAHVFGDDPVSARRLQQDILLLFTQLPNPLRLLMSGDFEKLKKSMDKALSVLSF